MPHVIELIWGILEKTQTNFPAKVLKNAKYFLRENTKKRKVSKGSETRKVPDTR